MKLSDYVFEFLASKGVNTVFYLPGGGCMHLVNSMGNSNAVNPVSLLHEQAVAVACEAYANTSGTPGVALVTTGPGGTNTVTGVLAAYLDSAPCFFMSGQVKTLDLKSRYGVRAHGSQEADIVSIVSTITKYAVMVTDKNTIRYHLERAWHEMTSGRKGPVWLDIPLDIQGADIDPSTLEGFTPDVTGVAVDVSSIINSLNQAKRPVIIAGNGLAGCKDGFYELIERLQIPVIPTWKAMDYVSNNHPLYAGRVGGMGDRHGNFTMQSADVILSLGCRLDFSITGFDRSEWAENAEKIVVEIDPAEIAKLEGAGHITPVIADVKDVVQALLAHQDKISLQDISPWISKIGQWKAKYPLMTKDKYTTTAGKLTTYALVDTLCKYLPEGAHVAPCSAGTTAEIFFQAFTVKPGQVIRSSHGLGSMGFEIPNAIGMCVAAGGKDVVCVAADGGMQLNIQELAVISGHKLPVKLFVVNNSGYASIRNMQNNHFNGNFVGCDSGSGLFLPDMQGIAKAYGIAYLSADTVDGLDGAVKASLEMDGPVLCEVVVDTECFVSPRTATRVLEDGSMRSSRLEDMAPFLGGDELMSSVIV